jgi:2,3-bisphosphoglycerate-independent phosphoglycerate mutase
MDSSLVEPKPVLLLILDGWGLASPESGGAQNSAIELARTPTWDRLWKSGAFPTTELVPHGSAVGLLPGQMGNSEVGHLNLGAGRVVWQDLPAISRMIDTGELAQHHALQQFFARAIGGSGALHFIGLFSDGGVHSHITHLYGFVNAALAAGVSGQIYIHALLDGRDTEPAVAERYFSEAEQRLPANASFATLGGRYFAMDRDKRWERVARHWGVIAHGDGPHAADWHSAMLHARARSEGDEFVTPTVLGSYGGMKDGDSVFFFNFRADRMRQLASCLLTAPGSVHTPQFERGRIPNVHVFSAKRYRDDLDNPVLLADETLDETLTQLASRSGLRIYKSAETEKYAHVTYFFNGGREAPWPGEERVLVPSPQVATYDLQPEMSLPEVTDKLVAALVGAEHELYIVNFANPDMVGHTGVREACIKACEAVDAALLRVLDAAQWGKAVNVIVTADHGNCDQLTWPDGTPHTQHSMNNVPVVLLGDGRCALRQFDAADPHSLCDIAPTILALLGLAQPASWDGESLIAPALAQ